MQLKLLDLGASLMKCLALMPNPSLNADVPHAWAVPTGGPPVSLVR